MSDKRKADARPFLSLITYHSSLSCRLARSCGPCPASRGRSPFEVRAPSSACWGASSMSCAKAHRGAPPCTVPGGRPPIHSRLSRPSRRRPLLQRPSASRRRTRPFFRRELVVVAGYSSRARGASPKRRPTRTAVTRPVRTRPSLCSSRFRLCCSPRGARVWARKFFGGEGRGRVVLGPRGALP